MTICVVIGLFVVRSVSSMLVLRHWLSPRHASMAFVEPTYQVALFRWLSWRLSLCDVIMYARLYLCSVNTSLRPTQNKSFVLVGAGAAVSALFADSSFRSRNMKTGWKVKFSENSSPLLVSRAGYGPACNLHNYSNITQRRDTKFYGDIFGCTRSLHSKPT